MLPLEEMDPQLTSIQPGGGLCMRIELAWGSIRRWYLKTFRAAYVARMRGCRKGEPRGCPHEVIDPRDLKFYRNQGGCYWDLADDPFAWRNRVPFARDGLCELFLISGAFFGLAAILGIACRNSAFWPVAAIPAVLGLCIVWFFRNPKRIPPKGDGVVVSPADGTIVLIEEIEYDEYVGGRAVLIGIFLSVFNVHINRSPIAARVIGLTYKKGRFLNALLAASARENEQLAVRIESTCASHRRMIVRQIAGAIARRIVCWLKPGDELALGAQFGMIKLGSRTELVLPNEPGLEIAVKLGQKVKAGSTLLAQYTSVPQPRPLGV